MSDMSDLSPEPGEEQLEAPEAADLEADLGLTLSDDERAQAEEMVARLRDQFSLGLDEPVEDQPPDAEEEEPEEEEPAEEEVAEPEPAEAVAEASPYLTVDGREYVVVDGTPVALDEIRQARRLATEQAQAPEPTAPAEPEPPDFLDLDDPRDAFMWTQMLEQQRAIQALAGYQQQTAAASARDRALAEVNQAMTTFRANHPELSEDDVNTVRVHAVALDIIDGLHKTRSGVDAVLKALDIAYMDHPEFRAKALNEPSPAQIKAQERKERKQKLGGLSGSRGAAPRTEPVQRATTDREMRQQAAQWLSEQGILG